MSTTFNVTMTSSSLDYNVTSLETNVTDADSRAESATGASIASPIVMFLAGLVGNVLALAVLHKTRTEIRSMMFYTLVAALTWNDLIGICLTSPPVLATYINQRVMPAPDKLCRFHAFAMVCFGLSTPLIVCTMAIERTLALKCSYFYSKYCTPSSARIVVIVLWAGVLLFGALPLFGLGSFHLQYPKTWCFLHFRSRAPLDMIYAYSYAVVNLAVVVVMVVCNALVMTTLCRVRNQRRRMSNASVNSTLLHADAVEEKARSVPHQGRRRHQRDVELQMIWLLCAITTIFSVCWGPLMVYILFSIHYPQHNSPLFGLVAVRLASLNQTLNPWIYVILRKSLLSRLRVLCKGCLPCGGEDPSDTPLPPAHKLTQYPRIYAPPAQRKGRPNNYVHVRHQLCPSSQFVGQNSEGDSVKEGHRKKSKGGSGNSSSRSRSRGENSFSEGGSRSYGRYCSETGSEWRSRGSSSDLCSVCRARLLIQQAEEQAGDDSRGSLSFSTSPSHSHSHHPSCSVITSPICSAVCDGSTEGESSRYGDRNYVNLFRHVPCSEISTSTTTDNHNHVGLVYPARPKTSCRPQARDGNLEVAHSAHSAHSYASEADDNGYVSRVSTDSSRMSTPERPCVELSQACEEDTGRPCHANSSLSNTAPSSGVQAGPGSHGLQHNPAHVTTDSVDLTSGVFDSRNDDDDDDDDDDERERGEKDDQETGKKRKNISRTVSCSSSSTPADSSSSHEPVSGSVYKRQLSSSSGH